MAPKTECKSGEIDKKSGSAKNDLNGCCEVYHLIDQPTFDLTVY